MTASWVLIAQPIVWVVGGAIGWYLGRGHYRQRCPATAWPIVPELCVCRCRACRRGEHPDYQDERP